MPGGDKNKHDHIPVPLELPKGMRSPAIVGQSSLLLNPWVIRSSSIVHVKLQELNGILTCMNIEQVGDGGLLHQALDNLVKAAVFVVFELVQIYPSFCKTNEHHRMIRLNSSTAHAVLPFAFFLLAGRGGPTRAAGSPWVTRG